MATPGRGAPYNVFEGRSEAIREGDNVVKPATLDEALQNLWDNAPSGTEVVHVVDIEIHGSNPIDMFRVIGDDH